MQIVFKPESMGHMTHAEMYVTWAILAIIGWGVGSNARAISRLHDEVEEFRRQLTGHRDYRP